MMGMGICKMNKILFLLGMVAVSLNVRGVNILDRPLTESEKHSFCEVMNLSSFQVVDRFAKCSRSNIEGKSIDGRLHNLLVDVASNQHGKRMLSFVIAKVEPSVKCAKTLMYMSEILSFPRNIFPNYRKTLPRSCIQTTETTNLKKNN